jgi:D-alanine---D-serine ligase
MEKKKVAVIFGGVSPEYEVSLMSSCSVIKAINREKYEVIMLGITRDGEWYRYIGDVEDVISDKWHLNKKNLTRAIIPPSRSSGIMEFPDGGEVVLTPIDVVFPVLHGRNGEDGTIQGLCELAGIPVVGSGSAASALCMDKDKSRKLVALEGIPVAKAITFRTPPTDEFLLSSATGFKLPIFVKPIIGGSSIGISKVGEYSELSQAVKHAFEFDDAVILEEGIDGLEVGCSVIGNHDLITGRANEIEVAEGFFDYNEKYTLINSKIHVPARISEEAEQKVLETGKAAFQILGCRGYARIDLFLSKNGEVFFNEANTIPGFTAYSQFPSMMKAIGMSYEEVVDRLIELGMEN